jgi:cell division protein FtsN
MQNLKKQHGGTILGIIIGLVIGLGIALGVAMMITKTPVPFTDKFGKTAGRQADQTGGVMADPNKPLYGNKAAAREAAKSLVKESESDQAPPPPNTVVQQPEPKVAKAEAKVPVAEQSTAEKKPDVKIVDARVEPKPEASDDKWNYYLQAGAFREQNDAEAMRAKLALMGVEAKVSERQSENGTLYRVRIGPFNQLDPMNKVRGKLSDNGVDAAVVRLSKQ